MSRHAAHFENEEIEAEHGGLVTVEYERQGHPYVYEDNDGRFMVPRESHVRIYHGRERLGVYCGHSQAIELVGGASRGFEIRYREGDVETYCPHSQTWEPVS